MMTTALRRFTENPHVILWGYLFLIAAAELLTSYSVQAGLLLHAFILIGLLLHSAFERVEQVRRLTLALVLAPLIRLLSLSLPLQEFPEATWHPIISIPLLIATWMIARQLRVSRRDVGLRAGNPLIQIMLIGGGITLGALEYAILSPKSLLPAPTWGTASLVALSLFVFTGFTEEIIFRGLFQSLAMPVLRRWALIYVSLLFGALHITYNSFSDFIFVTIVGLIFAYIVLWSDSILGVTLAHGLTNVTLFVLLPYLSQHATGTIATLIYWSIWIGTGLWLIAFGALMWRADVEGRLLLRDQPTMVDDPGPALPSLTQSRAWQRAQMGVLRLELGPRIHGTRVWQQLEQRGAVARVRQFPWRSLTPRVTSAFILGGVFGILGSAGLLLAFGGNGNNTAVAPVPTGVVVAEAVTPTARVGAEAATPTAPAVVAIVPTPTVANAEPTVAPTAAVVAAETPEPAQTALAVATVEPVQTALPTAVLAVSLPWPETIPTGMAYAPTDSWPFRFVGVDQKDEPFLIFRGGDRWIVLREQPRNGHPVPASATRANVEVNNTPATLLTYADEGRQLIWERDGRSLQLSARGLEADEIVQVANSLVPLDPAAFEARLTRATEGQQVGPSLLWPNTLPDGLVLQPVESFIEPPQEAGSPTEIEGYVTIFRSPTSAVTIGGGNIQPPPITGDEEAVQFGKLEGRLITNDESILLIVNTPNTAGALPHLDVLQDEKPALLPPVQQGPVFVVGDNISRADFEQVIANLQPISLQEFVPRVRGQNVTNLTYMWPTTLPNGYRVDTKSVTFGWDDFLLQGGRPYFSVTASNAGGDTITVQGGRESTGAAFVIPEGENVEQFFPTIRGQTATAARTSEGSIVIWSENDVFYSITSPSVDVDTLASIAENLRRLDASGFYAYLR